MNDKEVDTMSFNELVALSKSVSEQLDAWREMELQEVCLVFSNGFQVDLVQGRIMSQDVSISTDSLGEASVTCRILFSANFLERVSDE